VIVDALRKVRSAHYGLRALADLGDPTTVPTVLEFLSVQSRSSGGRPWRRSAFW
jgi:hypothetical protein